MCEVLSSAISQGGIGAVLGFVLSWVVEWYPKWDTLAARVKRLALLALCFAIGLALAVLRWRLCGTALSIEIVWDALAAGFAAFTMSQTAHVRKLE